MKNSLSELEVIASARAGGRAAGQASEADGSAGAGGASIDASEGNGLESGKLKRRAG